MTAFDTRLAPGGPGVLRSIPRKRSRALLWAAFALSVGATGPASAGEPVIVTVDPHASGSAPVVELAKGEHVSLIIEGAGDATIHLHGYDIEVEANADRPARMEFVADHSGWFPAMVHVHDALLGDREKPLFHLDIRTR